MLLSTRSAISLVIHTCLPKQLMMWYARISTPVDILRLKRVSEAVQPFLVDKLVHFVWGAQGKKVNSSLANIGFQWILQNIKLLAGIRVARKSLDFFLINRCFSIFLIIFFRMIFKHRCEICFYNLYLNN